MMAPNRGHLATINIYLLYMYVISLLQKYNENMQQFYDSLWCIP